MDYSMMGSKEDTFQFLYQMRPLKFKLVDTYGNPLGGHKSSPTFSTNPDGTFDVGVGEGKVLLQQAVFEDADQTLPRPETYFGDIAFQNDHVYLVSNTSGSCLGVIIDDKDLLPKSGQVERNFLNPDLPFEIIGNILNGRIEVIEKLARRRAELEQIQDEKAI